MLVEGTVINSSKIHEIFQSNDASSRRRQNEEDTKIEHNYKRGGNDCSVWIRTALSNVKQHDAIH
jgi:hypothetical protein